MYQIFFKRFFLLELPLTSLYLLLLIRFFYLTNDGNDKHRERKQYGKPGHTIYLIGAIFSILTPIVNIVMQLICLNLIYYARSEIRPENSKYNKSVADNNRHESEDS